MELATAIADVDTTDGVEPGVTSGRELGGIGTESEVPPGAEMVGWG